MMRSILAIITVSSLGACSFFGGSNRNLEACNPTLPEQAYSKTGQPLPMDPVVIPAYCDDPGSSLFGPAKSRAEVSRRKFLVPEDDMTKIDDSPRALPLAQPTTPVYTSDALIWDLRLGLAPLGSGNDLQNRRPENIREIK